MLLGDWVQSHFGRRSWGAQGLSCQQPREQSEPLSERWREDGGGKIEQG